MRSEADELRIKSFLKMFYFAHFSILLLGAMLASAWAMFVIDLDVMRRPAGRFVRSEAVCLAIYCLVVGLPEFLLWRSFKSSRSTFVSAQDAVSVSGPIPGQRRRVIQAALIVLGFAVIALALLWLVRLK